MATNKIEIVESSDGNFSFKSKCKNLWLAWKAGKLFNYSLIISYAVSLILLWIVFDLPANEKVFGFYNHKDNLAYSGIIAIILFIIQVISNIHYIVRFSVDKNSPKRIVHILFFSSVLLFSIILLIFGLTNTNSYNSHSWIFHYNLIITLPGYEFTSVGYAMVSIMSCVYVLMIVCAYLFLKKNVKLTFSKKTIKSAN
ncbi:MAG: hypothetical protein LBV48_00435 [Mycoplasmataceae bacterium]|jgi:hypothetical protein|nr:hypothetical protein [Mycoplasmataceae bacterium]